MDNTFYFFKVYEKTNRAELLFCANTMKIELKVEMFGILESWKVDELP